MHSFGISKQVMFVEVFQKNGRHYGVGAICSTQAMGRYWAFRPGDTPKIARHVIEKIG